MQVSKRQWNTGGPFDGRRAGCCADAGEAPSEAEESGKIPRKGSLMRHEGGVGDQKLWSERGAAGVLQAEGGP